MGPFSLHLWDSWVCLSQLVLSLGRGEGWYLLGPLKPQQRLLPQLGCCVLKVFVHLPRLQWGPHVVVVVVVTVSLQKEGRHLLSSSRQGWATALYPGSLTPSCLLQKQLQ
jgi:hypothetical protein